MNSSYVLYAKRTYAQCLYPLEKEPLLTKVWVGYRVSGATLQELCIAYFIVLIILYYKIC